MELKLFGSSYAKQTCMDMQSFCVFDKKKNSEPAANGDGPRRRPRQRQGSRKKWVADW